MKTVMMLLAALTVGACQPDTKNLEKKIDDLSKKVDQLAAGGGARAGAMAQPQRPQRPEPDRMKTYAVPVDGDPFDGPADAKVTIVKAYDYACPYCEKVRGTMEDLRKKYGNELRVVFKQFVVHPQVATAGALAFCAAAKQGKALQMDQDLWDKSFKNHSFDKDGCWNDDAGCPVVLGYAKELGLDENKMKADMKACKQVVDKDQADLQRFGVGATPSFFINGRFVAGAMPIENFTALVDEEMKKADDAIKAGTPKAEYYAQVVVGKGLKTLEAPKQ